MRGVTNDERNLFELQHISTHTPHARRDATCTKWKNGSKPFQLTRLMRGVTCNSHQLMNVSQISTHTPHARRDAALSTELDNIRNFNSHASCEA